MGSHHIFRFLGVEVSLFHHSRRFFVFHMQMFAIAQVDWCLVDKRLFSVERNRLCTQKVCVGALSSTVCKFTPCQQRKVHQLDQTLVVGS